MDEMIKSIQDLIDKVDFDYININDIPNIDLYMDQVTTFMDENLEKMKRNSEDKILTKTMINNYTKNDLLPPPNKKKYSKEHMLFLIFTYYFKNVLSINDIQKLLEPISKTFYGKEEKKGQFEDLYEKIFSLQKQQFNDIEKDIENKIEMSKEAFKNLNDDSELLFLFSFISLLSFEAFMKKHIVEKLIDQYFSSKEEDKNI
ncbi:uncharacterized protein DUF1836 [Natranaerovirga pectinivora]|uniref:Uncharacterized protein DUF1836 n=1 Tax=Natranaerovirga pectinivora TaxID=682400 RepID=A0A4R3MN47_9FIRM|nr:DUF1836 domain-containing protein [Natranaerovirga pectinivora]TCT14612.1 uncharacterized protein DUF1836 [Natranaerovirga pectinivora]